MELTELLKKAVDDKASDVFIVAGLPVTYKVNGRINRAEGPGLPPEETSALISRIYADAGDRDMAVLTSRGDDDFSFSIPGLSRFRVSAYKQRGTLAAVVRIVDTVLPNASDLGIPDTVLRLGDLSKGLVLVTGPAGNGKSTTLACMIDRINRTFSKHIITLEDPLEYLHRHQRSIVSQREIRMDTASYATALRASLRQAPDVILLGEMRDYETINVAMTAAETGHLIFSTLHTVGAVNSIDRIVDIFPPEQQHQIRVQLSMVLQAVVSQQLVPTVDGRVTPAFEIMLVNPAIRNLIRESKTYQLETVIYSSAAEGMITMDASLLNLYRSGTIDRKNALLYASSPDTLEKKLDLA